MKRSVNYSHLIGLVDASVSTYKKDPIQVEKREADLVCDLVFSPDKRTGLPSSDISVYLAKNTPVQVREFIKQNIFGEGLDRPSFSQDVDDDTILEMVRGSNETVEDYSVRVSNLMMNERDRVQESFAKLRNAQYMEKIKEE